MNSLLIEALTVGFLGSFLVAYFVFVVSRNFFGFSKGKQSRSKLAKKQTIFAEAQAAMDAEDFSQAGELLHNCFLLEYISGEESLQEKVHSHNFAVLERIINLSEITDGHIDNLSLIEGLLMSRLELARSYVDTMALIAKLKSRKKEKGSADWAVDEYSKKGKELKDQLLTNQHSIETQLKILFENLKKPRKEEGITFH